MISIPLEELACILNDMYEWMMDGDWKDIQLLSYYITTLAY